MRSIPFFKDFGRSPEPSAETERFSHSPVPTSVPASVSVPARPDVRHSAQRRHSARRLRAESILPWLLPIFLISLWQIAAQTGRLSPRILPAPTAVFQVAIELIKTGQLPRDIGVSAGRALLGFAIGGSIGFVLGIVNGVFKLAENLLDTSVQMLRTIPNLAMVPLVILWFGIGEEAKVCLVALGTFFPLYLNTYHGMRSADAGLKEMGRVYGLNRWGLFRHVIFPGALPSILVGLRFGLGSMWLILIAAEALAADSGIGFMTTTAREFMRTDVVVLGTLIYALLGKLADLIAKGLERSLLVWHPDYQLHHPR